MEKMTIHRGLAELKLLNSRAHNAANSGTYCVANKRSNKKINGMTIDQIKEKIKSDHDSAVALINRRNKIKTAIVMSNAVTKVTISGVEMTVAEAIERKSSINLDKDLLCSMKAAYKTALATLNKNNDGLTTKLEDHLKNQTGGKEKVEPAVIKQLSETFMELHEYDLIDPLGAEKKIKELDDSISGFEAEVDAILSESNATTFIEFE